jgi:pimeloyl-ACP methyl ester carboxylesterase
MDDTRLSDVTFEHVRTNGIRLHVAMARSVPGAVSAAEPSTGTRLTILLHGFPEFWYGWRKQIRFLAEHDLRIWAPDQRGYNLSDKPRAVAAYSIDELTKDVVGLIDAAGERRAHLVGHDWGAAVAWWTALKFPERVERLVILNVPHPAVMLRHLRRNFAQLRRSWYMLAFQIPRLPEMLARRSNWKPVIRAMQSSSRPGTFSVEDWQRYRQAWSQQAAFRSMIHWYRAAARAHPPLPINPRVRVPTLMTWGARDRFLGRELARPSIELCDTGRLVLLEEATHWVQHEEPDHVNRLILEHLS